MPIARKTDITYERVRELFNYNPATGDLIRRVDKRSGRGSKEGGGRIHCRAGDIVGSINGTTGYKVVRVDMVIYFVHRLIWLWQYGYFPENDIDHINRDKTDNRLENLREVTRSCNIKNRPLQGNNSTGVCGVEYRPKDKRWLARIAHNKEQVYLGVFKCKTEAVCHRFAAEQALDWKTCDTTSPARAYLIEQNILRA